MKHIAVGSFEAAALMGVHYTVPKRMVEKGILSAHFMDESAYSDAPTRTFAIYDASECEANYLEYEEMLAGRGGKSVRRPRGWLHLRPDCLKRLAKATSIDFEDAIGAFEASKILSVHISFIPRMVQQGKIVGRRPWNPRGATGSKILIISRRSCQQNAKENRAAEAAGTKRGRPRKKKS